MKVLTYVILFIAVVFIILFIGFRTQASSSRNNIEYIDLELDEIQKAIRDIYAIEFEPTSKAFYAYEIMGQEKDRHYHRIYVWMCVDEIDQNLRSVRGISLPLALVYSIDSNDESDENPNIFFMDEKPSVDRLIRYFYPDSEIFDIEEIQRNFPLDVRNYFLNKPTDLHIERLAKLKENNLWSARKYYQIEPKYDTE